MEPSARWDVKNAELQNKNYQLLHRYSNLSKLIQNQTRKIKYRESLEKSLVFAFFFFQIEKPTVPKNLLPMTVFTY